MNVQGGPGGQGGPSGNHGTSLNFQNSGGNGGPSNQGGQHQIVSLNPLLGHTI